MDNQIKELDRQIEDIAYELKTKRLTDLGKLITTRKLTELLKQQNELLKIKIERIENGNS